MAIYKCMHKSYHAPLSTRLLSIFVPSFSLIVCLRHFSAQRLPCGSFWAHMGCWSIGASRDLSLLSARDWRMHGLCEQVFLCNFFKLFFIWRCSVAKPSYSIVWVMIFFYLHNKYINPFYRHFTEEGICWARNSDVKEVDDTAMAFRLLRLHGYSVSPG